MFQSSNPTLAKDDSFQEYYGAAGRDESRANVATVQGVVNKTAIFVAIAVGGGVAGYSLVTQFPSLMWISCLGAMIIGLGIAFVLYGKPHLSPYIGPVYAIVEGVFLGALTQVLDSVLAGRMMAQASAEAVAAGSRVSLAMPAFLVTISVVLAMLGLYYARILRPTKKFQAVVGTMVLGCFIVYALSWVLAIFGIRMPLISVSSAFGSGWMPIVGLGLNALFLVVAALMLIIDFGRVEEIVSRGAPKHMEWYAAFALLVTIAWIYYEAVKLVFRLYVLFGSRD